MTNSLARGSYRSFLTPLPRGAGASSRLSWLIQEKAAAAQRIPPILLINPTVVAVNAPFSLCASTSGRPGEEIGLRRGEKFFDIRFGGRRAARYLIRGTELLQSRVVKFKVAAPVKIKVSSLTACLPLISQASE